MNIKDLVYAIADDALGLHGNSIESYVLFLLDKDGYPATGVVNNYEIDYKDRVELISAMIYATLCDIFIDAGRTNGNYQKEE